MHHKVISEHLSGTANARPDLLRIGRHCDVKFLPEIGKRAFHIAVRCGHVTGVQRGFLDRRAWCLAVRAADIDIARCPVHLMTGK